MGDKMHCWFSEHLFDGFALRTLTETPALGQQGKAALLTCLLTPKVRPPPPSCCSQYHWHTGRQPPCPSRNTSRFAVSLSPRHAPVNTSQGSKTKRRTLSTRTSGGASPLRSSGKNMMNV